MVLVRVADWFPLQPVAFPTRRSSDLPAHVPLVLVSLTRFTVEPPQLSLAVGGVNTGEFGHWMVSSAPAAPMVGGVVSTTVMVWVRVAEWFPLQSVASHVRVSV